jgi:hypothetical protein
MVTLLFGKSWPEIYSACRKIALPFAVIVSEAISGRGRKCRPEMVVRPLAPDKG